MTIGKPWNPRRHLSAAVGWSVFVIVAFLALLAANLAAAEAERRARNDAIELLGELAAQSQGMLDSRLGVRGLLLQTTAAQIAASSDRGAEALRRHLEALQEQFPEFAWLGVADQTGRVIAGTGAALQGEDLSAQQWFDLGRTAPNLEMRPSPGPQGLRRPSVIVGQPEQFVAIGVPLVGVAGQNVGVLGGYLAWSWVEGMQSEMLKLLGPRLELELVLTDADDSVLVGPASWLDRTVDPNQDLSEAGAYLTARAEPRPTVDTSVRWTETVRQPVASALAPAREARRIVFGVVLLAGLLAAATAACVTRRMLRPLSSLAIQADAVRNGTRSTLSAPPGDDEVSRIGATLATLVGQLQSEKQALKTLNSELDARVAERSARIEQLSDDARQAAVTRERLRLARDLHDTLAHSLMALLTQIRLIRKLQSRLDADQLDAELGLAEEVTASGLVDARAAIAQMRNSGVRESGLGAALQTLASRFGERTGIPIDIDADPAAAGIADTRAESVHRIAEETLRNIERHARAGHVQISLHTQPTSARESSVSARSSGSRFSLTIADDGIGFDSDAPHAGHYGLQGMREQAALINATLTVWSESGKGTRMSLDFEA